MFLLGGIKIDVSSFIRYLCQNRIQKDIMKMTFTSQGTCSVKANTKCPHISSSQIRTDLSLKNRI
jgi:hypothetical protein